MLTSVGPDIWIADGPEVVAVAGFHYPTRMAVIRLNDGGLFVWSPIALTPALRTAMAEIGEVRQVVAPNSLHHVFLGEWQSATPDARIFAAPGLRDKRPDIRFDGDLGDDPDPAWRGQIDQAILHGNRITTEAVFFHRASGTVLVADLIQHLPRGWFTGWRALVARLDLMTAAGPEMPRKFRLAFRDRRAAEPSADRILSWPAIQLVIAHGPMTCDGTDAVLARAFGWLTARPRF